MHKNKGRSPSMKTNDEIKQDIIDNYLLNYSDCNLTHYSEIVREDYSIKISNETIRLWMTSENIISLKIHKITKKRIRKRLKEELMKSTSK